MVGDGKVVKRKPQPPAPPGRNCTQKITAPPLQRPMEALWPQPQGSWGLQGCPHNFTAEGLTPALVEMGTDSGISPWALPPVWHPSCPVAITESQWAPRGWGQEQALALAWQQAALSQARRKVSCGPNVTGPADSCPSRTWERIWNFPVTRRKGWEWMPSPEPPLVARPGKLLGFP